MTCMIITVPLQFIYVIFLIKTKGRKKILKTKNCADQASPSLCPRPFLPPPPPFSAFHNSDGNRESRTDC